MHRFEGSEFIGQDNDGRFTPRQLECLVWASEGKEASAIAVLIERTPRVVKKHLEDAMHKLDANNRCLAIARAVSQGIIVVKTSGTRALAITLIAMAALLCSLTPGQEAVRITRNTRPQTSQQATARIREEAAAGPNLENAA